MLVYRLVETVVIRNVTDYIVSAVIHAWLYSSTG